MKVNLNIIFVAIIALLAFCIWHSYRKENFADTDYPLGLATVQITPYNKIVQMPYDLPPTLSTDSCLANCSMRQSSPNILLGKGVFEDKVSHGGSTTECIQACSM